MSSKMKKELSVCASLLSPETTDTPGNIPASWILKKQNKNKTASRFLGRIDQIGQFLKSFHSLEPGFLL